MCTNRLQNSIAVQRREIAALLQEGREEGARLKAEHLLREARTERAMEILTTLCELLISRMTYLATEKTCPPDLLSPLHSLLYCEPRLNVVELATVRRQLALKFGEAFVQEGLRNAKHQVHFKLVHALSLAPPLEIDVQHLLLSVAQQFSVDSWKPTVCLEPAGTFYDLLSRVSLGLEPVIAAMRRDDHAACRLPSPSGSGCRPSRRESMHATGEDGAACGGSSSSPTSARSKVPSPAATSSRASLHAAAAAAAVEAREAQVDSPCCFPSLRAPPSHAQASPQSALWIEEGQRASPQRSVRSLPLTSRTFRQADGCETPFHQEIHLGLSPPRSSSSSCLPPPRFAADRCAAPSRCPDTPAAAKWERHASPLGAENTAASSRSNTPSPHRQQGAAATLKAAAAAAAGTACSAGVPAAAVPAYSLV
ncbi:hypothetical protein Esti_006286 [Eimeria stiedai]